MLQVVCVEDAFAKITQLLYALLTIQQVVKIVRVNAFRDGA
jgi:hypothetical protein